MAESALKYDEFEDFDNIEPIQVPAGGIATFLTAKEGMFADDDELPDGGIASVKQVADQLAEYGRHEDDFMVHAAEGETVIPMEVFRKNPILKENIYKQMRDMGLEPERYVVGNDFNSINPVTGQPEFFLKKMFKKLGKFLKKAIKIILPIALNFFLPGLGVIASAAIGSGIGGLIQGESFGEALKSAAIGGLTAGVMKGVSGGIGSVKAGGKFGTGFKAGITGPRGTLREAMAAGKSAGDAGALVKAGGPSVDVSATLGTGHEAALNANKLETLSRELSKVPGMDANTIQNIVNDGLSKGLTVDQILVGQGVPFKEAVYTATGGITGTAAEQVAAREAALQSATPPVSEVSVVPEAVSEVSVVPEANYIDPGFEKRVLAGQGAVKPVSIDPVDFLETGTVDTPGIMEGIKKLGPGGDDFFEGLRDIFMPGSARRLAAEEIAGKSFQVGTKGFKDAVSTILKNSGDINFMRKFGPAALAAMGIGNLVSPGDNPESIDMSGGGINEAISLLEANPDKYDPFGGAKLSPRGAGQFNAYEIQPIYNQPLGTSYQSTARVAGGGGMDVNNYPPRTGAIAGQGTETSDDIPAMLSDGEFVMTAQAVRGAGNGSRSNGMRNMYDMMNNFESRV